MRALCFTTLSIDLCKYKNLKIFSKYAVWLHIFNFSVATALNDGGLSFNSLNYAKTEKKIKTC